MLDLVCIIYKGESVRPGVCYIWERVLDLVCVIYGGKVLDLVCVIYGGEC